MDVLDAATGVAGGAPPAIVEIVYCCANATLAPTSNRLHLNMLFQSRDFRIAWGIGALGVPPGKGPGCWGRVRDTRPGFGGQGPGDGAALSGRILIVIGIPRRRMRPGLGCRH